MIGRLRTILSSDSQVRVAFVSALAGGLATALLGSLGGGAIHVLDAIRTHDMAIVVPEPVVTGDGLKVILRNDGDRPGNLYGALLSFQSDKTDLKTETLVQLLPSEVTEGMLVNPGPPTFISLPFANVWQGRPT